jgi:hypothetical protein
VNLNSRQEASLLLSAVNLPGGVQVSSAGNNAPFNGYLLGPFSKATEAVSALPASAHALVSHLPSANMCLLLWLYRCCLLLLLCWCCLPPPLLLLLYWCCLLLPAPPQCRG